MAQTLYSSKGIINPIIKGDQLTAYDFEIVRLSAGDNNSKPGDLLSYDGQVTAGTPVTHRDVTIAAPVTADAQVALKGQGWCGILIEPVLIPDPVSGVAWDPSVGLIDGTLVRMLKRGARATVALIAVDTTAHDHLPGDGMGVAAAGEVKPIINTFTNTTPTGPENAAALIMSTLEYVGKIDQVSEDISNPEVVFINLSGY
ncbi:MAG: hypothetical protein IH840_00080 [Candidatus Heimdallarchaeota archaeon]|nr:hypothetical protein [Candidatus Heimdallarchaeota archaeon]